ncbi:hypothetical protein FPZ12_008755 [Amycolatopsis acidicola]|uniref:DUF732 domain-containing protein n=1 Tax=Amycolatopsis acidicola TaxID=2596893 RepID=A0A5N0VFK2_9PSEU|nr:hypothetical protein [Amycolatopsis acidicola]KAA9163591.1 hypothetical protein FPZ12_008755 [Amycolatopsis acidicola]
MTTVDERSTPRQRLISYLAVGIALGVLLVVGLLLFRSARSDAEAEAKANQLIARLNQEGARAPTQDQVIRLLGTDGGSICVDPNSALARAMSDSGLSNGAGGPGTRPVRTADTVITGETIVIEIYCPDKLPVFQEYVNGLSFAEVTGG